MRVVVDHFVGSRKGQRQDLPAEGRIRFGRHPDCEVAFDSVRDIDASSRHAELRITDGRWSLADLGSSNGTFVDGMRITEHKIEAGVAHTIAFGSEGPRVRLLIGDEDAVAQLPSLTPGRPRRRWWLWAAMIAAGLSVVSAAVWSQL
jgi:pSer/pThr/pTyr-binding forkhead associated (FHA) protein